MRTIASSESRTVISVATRSEQRYRAWRDDAEAAALAPLRQQQQHLDADHFTRLSVFLHDPAWEVTNNAAERGGRAFRHAQRPHFRLRRSEMIENQGETRISTVTKLANALGVKPDDLRRQPPED